jgi:ADP-dependent phosphofructokinase/glucokinase
MSHSEFQQILPESTALAEGMLALARRLDLARVCVHADEWAAAVTRLDTELERKALMAGCLLASCRAATGRPVAPKTYPQEAVFNDPPACSIASSDGWHFVSCSAPYLPHPVSTLGLGDTFTAGCLFVLGQPRARLLAQTRPPLASARADNLQA